MGDGGAGGAFLGLAAQAIGERAFGPRTLDFGLGRPPALGFDGAMPKSMWVFVGLFSGLLLLGLGGLQLRENSRALAAAEQAAIEARRAAELTSQTNAAYLSEVETLRAQTVELQQQIQAAAADRNALRQQMQSELESKDVTISELQGKLTLSILDRILFDSGRAAVKPEGRAVLKKVAGVLEKFPNRPVQVIGHTDNVPIHGRTPDGFSDNWELSAGRAVSAVRFLVEEAGVDPRRISAVGSGEFKPIADNATPEGRARNRRIAIVVLPEELGSADLPRPKPAEPAKPAKPAEPPEAGTPTP